MASPFSGRVLGTGALLASPALWACFGEGTMSVQTAVVRLAVAVLVCWLGFSMFDTLLDGTSAPAERPDDVPRALPGIDGPMPVRGAVIDPPQDTEAL
jgi:hypothetical protein